MYAAFTFFRDEVSTDPRGFGLVRDRAPRQPDFYSIASTGFGLAAYALGVERGWWTRAEATARSEKTLDTFLTLESHHGFFRHFYHGDGRPYDFEFSTIDTAIFLCGAKVAANYLGGAVAEKTCRLLRQVDWAYFLDGDTLMMAYHPSCGKFAYWDAYAEQLMLYVLAADVLGDRPYYAFRRDFGSYGGERFCYTYTGSLFTHQYSHAFIDFRGRRDGCGIDWFLNAAAATRAARAFCIDDAARHPAYRPDRWGLTACDTPWGYRGNQGSPPCGVLPNGEYAALSLGVVAPCAALGSLPFCPDICIEAFDAFWKEPRFRGRYGLFDAVSSERNWVSVDVLGIDKGIGLLQAANYRDGFIWDVFRDADIERALAILGINKYV